MSTIRNLALPVLIAASSILTLTSCRSAQDAPAALGCSVTIVVDLVDGVPVATPDPQIVRRGQSVEWVTDESNMTLEIEFKNENPLPERPSCRMGRCVGAPPKAGTEGRRFEYDILLRSGNQVYSADPILIIRG